MKKYKSYEDANNHGENDVWPGCGRQGRCMPCGQIHDFGYSGSYSGKWIHKFYCWANHEKGCPNPKLNPIHNFNDKGKCVRCGFIDEVISIRKKFSSVQINLIKKVATYINNSNETFSLYNTEYITARCLENKGFGLIKFDSFELTEKGLEVAKKLGFLTDK